MKETIYLNSMTLEFYERKGETWFRIKPIFGYQISIVFNRPLKSVKIREISDSKLTFGSWFYSVRMTFKTNHLSLEKVNISPIIFGIIPFGLYPCDISRKDKTLILDTMGNLNLTRRCT